MPLNARITHLCGGGDHDDNVPGLTVGGYIVFNNSSTYAYSLEGTVLNKLTGLGNGKIVSIISGGGGNPNIVGFNNNGTIVVGGDLYRIDNSSCILIKDATNLLNMGISEILEVNMGGYYDFYSGGFLLAQKNNGKYIFEYDKTNLLDTNIQADKIATMYVNNHYGESANNYSTLLYYLVGREIRYYQRDTSGNKNGLIISLPSDAGLLFLSGGGGENNPINNIYPAGYATYVLNGNYHVVFLDGTIHTTMNVNGLNIVALSGGVSIRKYVPFSTVDAHGYMVTSEGTPCVHQDTNVPVFKDGLIINKKISDIRSGDYVIKFDGTPIRVVNNAKLYDKSEYVEIKANSLGDNMPNTELYLTKGHPVLFNGKEVLPTNIVNDDISIKILPRPATVYTLITEERTAVKMNGADVYTWNVEDFNKRKYNCLLL